MTKPFIENNFLNSILVNSVFPHNLSDFCNKNQIKLIHITTDCVYSGNKGLYTEKDLHDCLDIYGKSKSLGEPKNCMVIRTSIIGQEKNNFVHLLSWIISQKGRTINGFKNHLWNGVTTKYLSEILYKIVKNNLYEKKLLHIHSPNDVSKYELLKLINEKLNLNIKIIEMKAKENINRTLRSVFDFSSKFIKKSVKEQIDEI